MAHLQTLPFSCVQVAGTKLWHVCQIPGVIIPIGSASDAELELPNQRCMNVTMYPGR